MCWLRKSLRFDLGGGGGGLSALRIGVCEKHRDWWIDVIERRIGDGDERRMGDGDERRMGDGNVVYSLVEASLPLNIPSIVAITAPGRC